MEETGRRFALYRDTTMTNRCSFDAYRVGVARTLFVARNAAEKQAALDRRIAGQRRLHAISQRPDGNNTASIMAFSDTREAIEESALYGSPDEIARKLEALQAMGVDYVLLNDGKPSRENLRRFARVVMPAFRTEPAVKAAE
jgi:alkanesulfonate monooxygenase SsuD/methylene tetrahydromethanopterin reductase-like flavin-dependent oxidoreductase (luciferase family)